MNFINLRCHIGIQPTSSAKTGTKAEVNACIIAAMLTTFPPNP